jgi:hypothetical protein
MYRIAKRRRQSGFTITLCCVQLGLDEKESIGEVGASQISISKVGAEKVGAPEVSAFKVSHYEARASHVGPSEVGAPEISLGKVGTFEILLPVPDFSPYEFTRLLQQSIDVPLVRSQVQMEQSLRVEQSETVGLLQGKAELALERVGRWQRQRFGEVPEQLMQTLHNPEDVEHLLCCLRVDSPPVPSTKSHLGDLLPGTKAVVHSATSKALPSKVGVYTATEVRPHEIGTGLPGAFIDRKVG